MAEIQEEYANFIQVAATPELCSSRLLYHCATNAHGIVKLTNVPLSVD